MWVWLERIGIRRERQGGKPVPVALGHLGSCFLLVFLGAIGGAIPALGQCPFDTLLGSVVGPGDRFGWSVSVDGEIAVVGAPKDTTASGATGSAVVYRLSGHDWTEEQVLVPAGGLAGDEFGSAVAVHGDAILVGAHFQDGGGSNSGAAYVFRFDGSTWVQVQKLTASDAAPGDEFGFSVALHGDVILVGAYKDDAPVQDVGSAYVFRFDGSAWVEEQKLVSSDGAVSDWFGHAVALDAFPYPNNGFALVGSRFDDDSGTQSGSAYVFSFDGSVWTEEDKLLASDGALGDNFGYAVSLSYPYAFVGSPFAGTTGGAAYVYRAQGPSWVEETILEPDDLGVNDRFGESVSTDGLVFLVGASNHDAGGTDAGCAYGFRVDGALWVEEWKLLAGVGGDKTGVAVAVSGPVSVAGGYASSALGTGSGVAFSFSMEQGTRYVTAVQGDMLGRSMAVRGKVAVAGADDHLANKGKAFVFRDNGLWWEREQTLAASDGSAGDAFGYYGVSTDGDVVLIGAPFSGNPSASGSVYAFRFDGDTWVEEQKLVADPVAQAFLGASVAVAEDVAVAGAPGLGQTGAAYVFRHNGSAWMEERRLMPGDGLPGQFGIAVALSGDVIAVGADQNSGTGAVYVFRFTGGVWMQEQKLVPSDGAAGDYFGVSVSAGPDVIVVGAFRNEHQGIADAGAAYVFRFDGNVWVQEQKLTARDPGEMDLFGLPVAILGNVLAVGAQGHGMDQGAAYVFVHDGAVWTQDERLLAGDGSPIGDKFGVVALASSSVLVGAPENNEPGLAEQGAVYAFRFNDRDCNGNGMPDYCDIALGGSSDADGNAVPDECETPASASPPRADRKLGILLHQNHPNPFRAGTAITFELSSPAPVVLRVFDARGRLVRTLIDGEILSGPVHSVRWDGRTEAGGDAPAGIYFYRVSLGNTSARERMTLIR